MYSSMETLSFDTQVRQNIEWKANFLKVQNLNLNIMEGNNKILIEKQGYWRETEKIEQIKSIFDTK